MWDGVLWGLVQGLTEFLPVSSSGHLALVPALLDRQGPDLATSAVLHLGTLVAVIAYFRSDLALAARFRREEKGRAVLRLVAIGTIPVALLGLPLEGPIDDLFTEPIWAAWALLVTGAVLVASRFAAAGPNTLPQARWRDAVAVGTAQVAALVPGISRSGMTIAAGMGRRLVPTEAARFSFLLGIPAIAAGGLSQALDLSGSGGLGSEVWVATAVAAASGYAAIAIMMRLLDRIGLGPFAWYCFALGVVSIAVLA